MPTETVAGECRDAEFLKQSDGGGPHYLYYFGPTFDGNLNDSWDGHDLPDYQRGHTYWVEENVHKEMMMGGYFERSCIKYYLKQVPAEASRPALPTGEFKLIKKDQGFIQIERVETGLKIVLKCPKMEQIVVGMSNGSTTGFFLNKARTNILKVHRLVSGKDKLIWEHSGVRHTISLENEENFLVYSDQIYLWFLRAIDIEEPKEFTIEGVFDLDTVKLIKEAVKFYVSKMFERHLTPYKCKVSFSFTEIEEIVLKSEEVSS